MAKDCNPGRRRFLKSGLTGAAVAAAGMAVEKAYAQKVTWHQTADVIIAGAGVSGLACACVARDQGASVLMVEENFDIGGRGMLSGGGI
jgi:ribulose 1,5-bisphosphate synthetase/thiazole synthase